jgi:hypothetical protein
VIFVLSAMQTISSLALTVISTLQYIMALTHAANRSHERRKRPQRRDTSESVTSLSSSMEDRIETPAEVISDGMTDEDILLPSLKLVGDLIQAGDRLPTSASLLLLRFSGRLCQPWFEK